MNETWVCYECAQRCDPAHPDEYSVVQGGSGYTIALHKWCVEPYMERRPEQTPIRIPPASPTSET